MTNNQTDKKDYIDEHDEWQKHQFDPGHFTSGNIPVWIKYPGKRKRLGALFLIIGLFYGAWGTYNIIQIIQIGQTTEQIMSAIFMSLVAIIFLSAGIKFMKKSTKE